MTNKTITAAALAAILLTAPGCRKNDNNGPNVPPETIVLTLKKKAGNNNLYIYLIPTSEKDGASVWADLNGNGKKDEGEAITKWQKRGGLYNGSHIPRSSKITIHGKVKWLWCRHEGGGLTSLAANSATLEELTVHDTNLTELDARKLPALKTLYCRSNRLTSLDLSNNKALTKIICESNRLTSLNLSNNKALKVINCSSNQLTSLDLSNNKELIEILCYKNAIKGADMDRLLNSLPDVKGKRAQIFIIYSGDTDEKNVCTKAQVKIAIGKGWKIIDRFSYNPYPGS